MCATSFSVVQKTTLGLSPPACLRSATMNSMPLITGMFQSSRIRSGIASAHLPSASSPFSASLTSKPKLSTIWRETLRITRESSTIRQLFIPGFPVGLPFEYRTKVSLALSGGRVLVPGDQSVDVEQQQGADGTFDHPGGRAAPARSRIAHRRVRFAKRLDDVVGGVDLEAVEMP